MAIKVAFIGAGSIGFTRRLVRDILVVPELRDTHFSFTDINKRNLDMITELTQNEINHYKVPAKLSASTNRRKVLEGADYVINCVRIGGLEAFEQDVNIPLKYGVDQCVGDTLCIGGIMYGQRGIPCILDFCKDIREVAKKDAMLLNYSNPNAMITWAANEFGGIPTLGLCHGVQGGHKQIASVIEFLINKGKQKGDKGFRPVTRNEVDIICAGINHQTWYLRAFYDGKDWTDRLLEGFENHPVYSKNEMVRIDVLRRFGYYSTESNGHLSEYLPWYRKRPKDVRKWISLDCWINGETGGYLRVCTEGRNWFKTDFKKVMKEEIKPLLPENRSDEHGSYIIEALETGRVYRGHFNVVNNGCISNLANDCIVEVPCYVDHNGISTPIVGDLPMACAASLSASVNVQRMSVWAAITGDVTLLKQAVLHDPLTGAVCDTEEVWQMVDEMLIAQAKWLPQYKKAIPAAKQRMAAVKRKGDYRGTNKTRGVVRIKIRTVKELRKSPEQARREALAADKAAAVRAEQADSGKIKKKK